MGIPAGVTHVVFGGARGQGEVWESGFWTYGANPTTSASANALAQLWRIQLGAADGSGAARINMQTWCATATSIHYVRVYVYNTGGTAADLIGEYVTTDLTGTGARELPLQCSLVVTLKTGLAGRQHRGRMYMPLDRLNGGTGGEVTLTNSQTVATAWALCFTDWNASGDNGTVVVVSRVGAGSHAPVTSVSIDTRVDIQRRRANKQLVTGIASGVVAVP